MKKKIFCVTLPLKFDRFYIVNFHSALSQPCNDDERPCENLQCNNEQTLSVDANHLDLFDQSQQNCTARDKTVH